MSSKTNIKKQCLIILSVLVFYSNAVQADAPVKIPPGMRMSAGLHKRSDGSFCAIDPRGKSALTPSFVKPSLSAKPSIPKGVLECNAQETKAFQKKIKTAYLQTQDGAQLQKTMGGAVLGNVLKGLGVGCAVATGINLTIEVILAASTGRNQKRRGVLTEAKGFCVECALSGVAGGLLGLVEGGFSGLAAGYKVADKIEADLTKEAVLAEKARLTEMVKKMSPEDIANKLRTEENRLTEYKKDYNTTLNRKRFVKGDFMQLAYIYDMKQIDHDAHMIKESMDRQERRVKFWRGVSLESSRAEAIHKTAVRRVNKLSLGHTIRRDLIPDDKKQAIIQKHSKALHKLPGVTGFLSGAAGAVICNEGTVFVLNKEDPKI